MQYIKSTLIASIVIMAIGIIGYTAHLEFVVMPELLVKHRYPTWPHFAAMLVIIASSAAVGSWVSRRIIFAVYRDLLSNHLNPLTSSIVNLVSGAWHNEATVERGAFVTGARLGYGIRDEVIEPDRSQIEASLSGMAMPAPKSLAGQNTDVVGEMDDYMEQQRKARLSS